MIASVPIRADVLARLATATDEILRLGVSRLALFGSVQRETAGPDSDIDVLVEFQPGEKTYMHFFALGELLEERLSRRVELVTPESLSPFVLQRVLTEAADVIRAA